MNEAQKNRAIGKRLAEARAAKGLERDQLAKRMGYSKATIQHHENGERGIRRAVAEEYAKILKFDVEWLYTGVGEMAESQPGAEIVRIMPFLSEADRRKVEEYARLLAERKDNEAER